MANLIFTSVVLDPLVCGRIARLNKSFDDLRSPEGLAIVGRKYPTHVKTLWIYIAYVLDFILRYLDDVNSARSALFHNPCHPTVKKRQWRELRMKLL
jgi:uncharacterized MAPEG superfamily protein